MKRSELKQIIKEALLEGSVNAKTASKTAHKESESLIKYMSNLLSNRGMYNINSKFRQELTTLIDKYLGKMF